ncbi:hypothetical protein Psuf_002020 [Phytohabitans suffuscus]|uniref:Uncharacterized protein n=1 Tax=Phytohabitans suffuscus TaxID=624315 RepID=A0A6F8YA33_9ACTN|nr:hypothetical protein Psuf_002020 [Phytohabitans suffuscus]
MSERQRERVPQAGDAPGRVGGDLGRASAEAAGTQAVGGGREPGRVAQRRRVEQGRRVAGTVRGQVRADEYQGGAGA